MKKISSFVTSEDGTNEEQKNPIIDFLESIRDNPLMARILFQIFKIYLKGQIDSFLDKNNMTFFNNLIDEIFNENNTFFDDLFDVIEKHPEIINDAIILVIKNDIQVKNFVYYNFALFKFIQYHIYRVLNLEYTINKIK